MSLVAPKLQVSGWTNFLGGVNSHVTPTILRPDQLSFAVNVSLRGGYAETRPGFSERQIVFGNTEMQSWVEGHPIQGYIEYESFSELKGGNFFLFSCGGRLFKLDISSAYACSEVTPEKVTELVDTFVSPAIGDPIAITVVDWVDIFVGYPIRIGAGVYTVLSKNGNEITCQNVSQTPGISVGAGQAVYYLDPNNDEGQRTYFVQAGKYVVAQDGRARAIIYDGSTSRRATEDPPEVPTGTVMAFVQGRIWVAISPTEYVAGDIVDGPTGVLQFTENNLIKGGGSFKVPQGSGGIRAMIPLANLDTTLGQGPLQVITENRFLTVNAPTDRSTWATVSDPIQTVSVVHSGALDQYGVAIVNGDIYFRARDGVRSFVMARREFGTWGQTPVSLEMSRAFGDDDPSLTRFESMVVFDNRLLTTVSPLPDFNSSGVYCRGIVPLNFDSVSSMQGKSPPVWEGVWTGVQPYFLLAGTFSGQHRCFAFSRNKTDGVTELWEISRKDSFDNGSGRIECFIETGSALQRSALELSSLEQAEVWVDRIAGTVDMTLKYRPDQYPCWFDWPNDKTICSKYKDCTQELSGCLISHNFGAGYKTRQRWGRPPEVDESFDNKPAYHCYESQLRLQWTGRARVKALLLKSIEIEEEPHAGDL